MGPYFVWVSGQQVQYPDMTNTAFTLSLAGFTFLVLYGLINGGRLMEDPFEEGGGFDNIHLQHDLAVTTQQIVFNLRQTQLETALAAKGVKP